MTPAQAYRILGLPRGCGERDLTLRFRQLARRAHPDAGGSDPRFSELSHAYAVAFDDLARGHRDQAVTTHVTSAHGRIQRLQRNLQRRLHLLGVGRPHVRHIEGDR